jgi:hypothetical protein
MSSKDKMCNGCYNELTLAQYKALMQQIEQEEMEKLQEELEQQTLTTKKTIKKFKDATEEE